MGGCIKVALAEDHELVRQGLVTLIDLEDDMSVSFEVSNGQELMYKIKDNQPDVLLLDVEMPIMNGLESLSLICSQYPSTKVLMVSMHSQKEMICACINQGAKGFITKNCDFDKVAHAIRTVHRSGFYFDENLPVSSIRELLGGEILEESDLVLSEREVEIIKLVCQGFKNREIAEKLFLSKRTVENHRRRIVAKTDTKSTVDLVVFALKNGLIELNNL